MFEGVTLSKDNIILEGIVVKFSRFDVYLQDNKYFICRQGTTDIVSCTDKELFEDICYEQGWEI